jgi:hypothetical protein
VYYELDEHPLLLREYWVKGDNGKEGLYSTQGWDWKMKALKRRFLSSLLSEQDSKILGEFYSRLMVRDSIVIRYQDNLHKHIINFDNVIGEKELLTRTIKLKMIEKIDRNRDSYFYNYNFISINEKIKEKEYIFCLMLIIYKL